MSLADTILLKLQTYRLAILHASPLTEDTLYSQFPLSQVLTYYQQVGKHFVDKRILEELNAIKMVLDEYHGTEQHTRILQFFLEMALDKHLGYYNYDSYTGSRFLADISIDINANFEEYMAVGVAHLILHLCDIALFECKTILGEDQRFPDYLIPYQSRKKRILNSLKGIQAYQALTDRLVITDELGVCVDLLSQEQAEEMEVPLQTYAFVCEVLDAIVLQLPEAVRTICTMTMQPVWTVHDEYMFIRILQVFETIFSIIVKGFLTCQNLLQQGDYQPCAVVMDTLSAIFQHSPTLFRVLMSMPQETFAIFRVYTEGASAIQSEQYKLIESLAARPAHARVQSAAYLSVPRVKEDYENGDIRSFEDMFEFGEYDREDPDFQSFIQSMQNFEQYFMQWKKMHVNIAVKMVGSLPGTGYTPGSPYLKANVATRLFPFLQAY